jgi:hypothetical protein
MCPFTVKWVVPTCVSEAQALVIDRCLQTNSVTIQRWILFFFSRQSSWESSMWLRTRRRRSGSSKSLGYQKTKFGSG